MSQRLVHFKLPAPLTWSEIERALEQDKLEGKVDKRCPREDFAAGYASAYAHYRAGDRAAVDRVRHLLELIEAVAAQASQVRASLK